MVCCHHALLVERPLYLHRRPYRQVAPTLSLEDALARTRTSTRLSTRLRKVIAFMPLAMICMLGYSSSNSIMINRIGVVDAMAWLPRVPLASSSWLWHQPQSQSPSSLILLLSLPLPPQRLQPPRRNTMITRNSMKGLPMSDNSEQDSSLSLTTPWNSSDQHRTKGVEEEEVEDHDDYDDDNVKNKSGNTSTVRNDWRTIRQADDDVEGECHEPNHHGDVSRPIRYGTVAASVSSENDARQEEYERQQQTYRTNLILSELAYTCASSMATTDSKGGGSGKTAARDAAQRAWSILREMPHPDTVACNSVLKALAKVAPAKLAVQLPALGAHRQQQQQQDRTQENERESKQVRSDVRDDVDVMDDNTGIMIQRKAPVDQRTESLPANVLAERLLQEMKIMHAQQVEANQVWYSALQSASTYHNDSNTHPMRGKNKTTAATKMDILLQQGPARVRIKPNVRSYATVMDAHARTASRESAQAAGLILQQLQQQWEQTADPALQPNLICYNTVLSAWAKASGSIAADQSLRILRKDMPRVGIAPDVISYNSVLHALARSGRSDAGEMAESILRSMTTTMTTTTTMQTAVTSPTTTPSENHSASTTDTSVIPNVRTYATVMDAWGQCHRPDKAIALFQEMMSRLDTAGSSANYGFRPSCVMYTTLIHALSVANPSSSSSSSSSSKDGSSSLRTTLSQKASIALALLEDMVYRGIEPNRMTWNALLNCCATSTAVTISLATGMAAIGSGSSGSGMRVMMGQNSNTKNRSHKNSSHDKIASSSLTNFSQEHAEIVSVMDLVRALYHRMLSRNDPGPDHVTFGTVLKACANQNFRSTENEAFAVRVFQDACRMGHVNHGVIRQFQQAVRMTTFETVMETSLNEAEDHHHQNQNPNAGSKRSSSASVALPASWTRNVYEQNSRRKRSSWNTTTKF